MYKYTYKNRNSPIYIRGQLQRLRVCNYIPSEFVGKDQREIGK